MKKHTLWPPLLAPRMTTCDFTDDWRICTDNMAPNAAPHGQAEQKVSGCLRTAADAHEFCAIHSYLSTAADAASASSTPSSCS